MTPTWTYDAAGGNWHWWTYPRALCGLEFGTGPRMMDMAPADRQCPRCTALLAAAASVTPSPLPSIARALGLPADATLDQVLSEAGLFSALRGQVANGVRAQVLALQHEPSATVLRVEHLPDLRRLGQFLGDEVVVLLGTAAVRDVLSKESA